MGGGTPRGPHPSAASPGPSPRGRGHPRTATGPATRTGAIPAWAGAPTRGKDDSAHPQGHPRVGGGTQWRRSLMWQARGPSPRGRGHLSFISISVSSRGAIPAWAGAPFIPPFHRHCVTGPSPRGRGHRAKLRPSRSGARAIPAWAGAPWISPGGASGRGGHPRVGGGTVLDKRGGESRGGPSPRGRGHPPSC